MNYRGAMGGEYGVGVWMLVSWTWNEWLMVGCEVWVRVGGFLIYIYVKV
jgi:hypothetical protein